MPFQRRFGLSTPPTAVPGQILRENFSIFSPLFIFTSVFCLRHTNAAPPLFVKVISRTLKDFLISSSVCSHSFSFFAAYLICACKLVGWGRSLNKLKSPLGKRTP